MLGVISFDAARYGPAATLTAINTAAQEAGHLLSSIALDTAEPATVVEPRTGCPPRARTGG